MIAVTTKSSTIETPDLHFRGMNHHPVSIERRTTQATLRPRRVVGSHWPRNRFGRRETFTVVELARDRPVRFLKLVRSIDSTLNVISFWRLPNSGN
jgi:hypothetical protein